MSMTRYKIRLWKHDGETCDASAVTFDSFAEAEAQFNDLQVSEETPCVEVHQRADRERVHYRRRSFERSEVHIGI